MNGPHDMGGMQCFGSVSPEPDEPVFHAEWEKKALALTVAMGFAGMWNLDASRHARESLPPAFYLSSSYYRIWLAGLERLLAERGLATESEIASGRMESPAIELRRAIPASASEMKAALSAGGPTRRSSNGEAKFSTGERVRTRNHRPCGHTRLPSYAREKVGIIEAIHGLHVFPDSNAHGSGEDPQWLYTVAFEAGELFGDSADSRDSVRLDCWEPYLERA